MIASSDNTVVGVGSIAHPVTKVTDSDPNDMIVRDVDNKATFVVEVHPGNGGVSIARFFFNHSALSSPSRFSQNLAPQQAL